MAKLHTIEQEILEATGERKKGRKEDQQAYLIRLVNAVAQLSDEEWEDLSEPTQEWFNEAGTALNDKDEDPDKELPDFDSVGAEDTADEDDDDDDDEEKESKQITADKLKVGQEIRVLSKRDKVLAEGEVVKAASRKVTVLDDDGDEIAIAHAKIGSIELLSADSDSSVADEDEDDDDEDDDEEEAPAKRTRAKRSSKSGTARVRTRNKKPSRSKAKAADEDDDEDDDEDEDEDEAPPKSRAKRTRASRGSSSESDKPKRQQGIGAAIREECCKYPKMSIEKITARLEKQGFDVNPATLKLEYNKVHSILDLLKEHDKLA